MPSRAAMSNEMNAAMSLMTITMEPRRTLLQGRKAAFACPAYQDGDAYTVITLDIRTRSECLHDGKVASKIMPVTIV